MNNQLKFRESSSLSSSSSSINDKQFKFQTYSSNEQIKNFQRLLSRFDKMATKTLLPSSPHISNRYFFRSKSNDLRHKKKSSKNKLDYTSPDSRKRYKFSSVHPNQHNNNIYKFPTKQTQQRAHSSESDRYFFPLNSPNRNSQPSLAHLRSISNYDQRSAKFYRSSSTSISDTPYLFSKTTEIPRYRTTTSTYAHPQGKRII